jgi:type III restriction enzyme
VEERTDCYEIDVQGKRLIERHVNTQSVFAFAEVPTNWTDLALSRELDPPLRKRYIRQEVLLEFIRRTLRYLEECRKIKLNTLYRVRVALERALREKIAHYYQTAIAKGYQLRLFSEEAAVETSYEYAFDFDPDNYPATLHYNGGFQFPKHYYKSMVGEFDSKDELECAKVIEMCPRVKRWVRNVPGMFGLPLAHGMFYPDFVVELDDGRMLVVEYKGAPFVAIGQDKKNIGEKWEEKSGGKAIFLWAVKKDSQGREFYHQLQDKIAAQNPTG